MPWAHKSSRALRREIAWCVTCYLVQGRQKAQQQHTGLALLSFLARTATAGLYSKGLLCRTGKLSLPSKEHGMLPPQSRAARCLRGFPPPPPRWGTSALLNCFTRPATADLHHADAAREQAQHVLSLGNHNRLYVLQLLAIALWPSTQPPWPCSNSGQDCQALCTADVNQLLLDIDLSAAEAYMLQRPQLLMASKNVATLWPSCCLKFSIMQRSCPGSELTLLSGENITRRSAMLAALCDTDTSSIHRIVSAGPLRHCLAGVAAPVHFSSHIANGLDRASLGTETAVKRSVDTFRAGLTVSVHPSVLSPSHRWPCNAFPRKDSRTPPLSLTTQARESFLSMLLLLRSRALHAPIREMPLKRLTSGAL